MTKEEKTTRIHKRLADQLDIIRSKRLKNLRDTKKMSDRKITGLITHHDSWEEIKTDIIKLDNKKIKKVLNE